MTAPNSWTPAEDAAVSAHYAKHGAQAALDALSGVSVAQRTLKAVERLGSDGAKTAITAADAVPAIKLIGSAA